mmetsp:Transcript_21479/g.47109  ORF Transcript_21479/g.47109 Transcript_21479/m.47109 type:complete len:291 (-) Transcript_21479:73-945(-)
MPRLLRLRFPGRRNAAVVVSSKHEPEQGRVRHNVLHKQRSPATAHISRCDGLLEHGAKFLGSTTRSLIRSQLRLDCRHGLGNKGRGGLNSSYERASDERHLSGVHGNSNGRVNHVRVLLASDLRHQEVLGSEAHHHTETLTRSENHSVLSVALQPCASEKSVLDRLGVAQARETSQLQHTGDVEDRREAHPDTEGRQERIRRPQIARDVEVQARRHLLHADTCKPTGKRRSRGAERLLQVGSQGVLAGKIVRGQDAEPIEGDAGDVGDDGRAQAATKLDLISGQSGGIHG